MTLKQTLDVIEIIDNAFVTGADVVEIFKDFVFVETDVQTVEGDSGSTDFVKITIKGSEGKLSGGNARTMGIVGRLGGIGARPSRIGMVSDADGAVAAITSALKLAEMSVKGDRLKGDIVITTHICPNAPTEPHYPVDFMGSPVDILTMNKYEITEDVDAIISIDTTKGNVIFNHKGIAISPTVKEGYILKFSPDLVRILSMTTGINPVTFAVTTQDITPYGNDVYHVNSILQPAVATDVPVVGVAITAESAVPGCGTGASHEVDIAQAARYAVEVAKEFTNGTAEFYDEPEFEKIVSLYGSMKHLQTLGKQYEEI
jgi:hypothetical protein